MKNGMTKLKTAWLLCSCVTLSGVVSLSGCNQTDISEIEDLQAVSVFTRSDQLPRTFKYITSRQRYERDQFEQDVTSGLNRWIGALDPADLQVDWSVPDFLDQLPEPIQQVGMLDDLDQISFDTSDANFIQQRYWMSEIARRIGRPELSDAESADPNRVFDFNWLLNLARQQMDPSELEQLADSRSLLADAVGKLHPELTAEEADDLAVTLRLFDWTIRNIMLEATDAWPDPATVERDRIADPAMALNSQWPPALGVIGPGYPLPPWKALTHGRGDYIERAQVFLGLVEQADLLGVMLAVPTGSSESAAVPADAASPDAATGSQAATQRPYLEWLPAVLIGDQLYLFDTELGLPLPGKLPGQIATFQQVRSDPALLKQLQLTPDESTEPIDYRVTFEQLEQVMALLNVSPESTSKRMAILESKLSGEYRIQLASSPQDIDARVAHLPDSMPVRPWHIPWSASLFTRAVNDALNRAGLDQRITERLRWYFENEQYIDEFVAYRTSRTLLNMGKYQTPRGDTKHNAITAFNMMVYSDEEISNFETNTLLQRVLGINKGPSQSFADWEAQLLRMKDNMTKVRVDAVYNIALAHYENGYPEPAINWLERIRSLDHLNRRTAPADYLMARSHEATENFQQAISIYRRSSSPQRHGNLLRARFLTRLADDDS